MRNLKKLASLLLALVMVLSLTVTAFASETPTTTSLTIKTTVNHTYKVYQLLKGDVYNLVDGKGTLSNVVAGKDLKADTNIDTFLNTFKDKSGADLGNTAYGYIANPASPYQTVVGDGNDKTISNIDFGYYIVVDEYTGTGEVTDGSDTVSRYMVAVVGPTTMTPKVSTPSIDKKIIDTDANKAIDTSKKTDTAAIGDVIEYEVTGTVPDTTGYTYYYYVLNDTLSKGLTLDKESFEVTIGGKTMVLGKDYYVYYSEDDSSFELALEDLKELVDTEGNGITVGSNISIKYKATVNDNAEIGKDPNTNTVQLEYSNNPSKSERKDEEKKPGTPGPGTATGEGPESVTKTYVTELTILKVDDQNKKLQGAEFTLTGDNLNKVIVETNTTFREATADETAEYYKLTNGTYTKTAPSPAAVGQEGYNADKYEDTTPKYVRVTTVTTSTAATGSPKQIVGTVNAEGYIIFTGLNAGTYILTETKTPEGYNTAPAVTFTISATQTGSTNNVGGQITWASNNAAIQLDAANGVFDATVVNKPGVQLPSTGGMGTTLFYIAGGILVLAAVVLLVTKKRMQNAE